MKLQSAIDQLLASYLPAVPGQACSVVSKGTMDQLVIRRSVQCLASLEYILGPARPIRLKVSSLYHILVHTHEDWYIEVPVLPFPSTTGPLVFIRKPRVPLRSFSGAWTIARGMALLEGRTAIGLHSTVRAELIRLLRNQREGGDVKVSERGPPNWRKAPAVAA